MLNYRDSKAMVPITWFILAFVTACVFAAIFPSDPLGHPDALSYDANARHLLEYGEIKDRHEGLRAWRPPGATLFFAAIYAVSGINQQAVILIQIVLFALVVGLLSDATRRVTSDVATGHIAGALALAFYSIFNYSTILLSEQLHMFFLSISLWVLVFIQKNETECASLWKVGGAAFGLGVALGLAAVVKSYLFYFPAYLLLAVLLFLGFKRLPCSVRLARFFILGVVGFSVVVAPFLVRNYGVIGTYGKLVTYGGYNLYLGNYALTRGDWLNPTATRWYAEIENKMADISVKASGEAERDSALSKEALRVIADHPGIFILKSAGQAARLLSTAGAKGDGIERVFSIAFYMTFVFLSGLGLVFAFRLSSPMSVGFLIFGSYVIIVFSATFSAPRLNMPLTIMFPTLCAIALSRLHPLLCKFFHSWKPCLLRGRK